MCSQSVALYHDCRAYDKTEANVTVLHVLALQHLANNILAKLNLKKYLNNYKYKAKFLTVIDLSDVVDQKNLRLSTLHCFIADQLMVVYIVL